MLHLYIGNKNYSSWSLRPWLVLKVFGIAFQEHQLQFDDFQLSSPFKQQLLKLHPTAKVPLLQDADLVVADSLAICEYLAETHPDLYLWPKDKVQRAQARSMCAEMHSSFGHLRDACPMNVEADLVEVGLDLYQSNAGLREDLQRIQSIWAARPSLDGFLCGEQFSIADAFYAPVVLRLVGYGLPILPVNQAYVQRIQGLEALKLWQAEARQEHCFVPIDEPYRTAPESAP